MTQILLWLNILISVLTLIPALLKRQYPTATLLLCCGLLSSAGLCYTELQLLEFPGQLFLWRKYGLLLESAMTFSLYYYTKTVFRDNREIYRGPGFWVSLFVAAATFIYALVTPIERLVFSPDFADEKIIFLTSSGFAVYLVLMLFLVFSLVQLERTLSGLHQLQRWQVKLEVIGSGLLLAIMALYFSHSLLYRSLNLNYIGWRAGVVIAALGLLLYSRLFRSGYGRLALSRGIAHRSFVLLVVGGYLIILGLLGEGLRYLNLDHFRPLIYLLLLLGGLGLALLFLSERLRRKLQVLLHKNFYQSKYDYRQQWDLFARRIAANKTLKEIETGILDLFCETFACKGAVLYLEAPESGDYLFSSAFNFRRDWRPFSCSDPLVDALKNRDWIINLNEAEANFKGSGIEGLADLNVLLVVPLLFDEQLVGFIILGEQINAGEELTYEDYDLMRMLARQSVATIQGLRLADQLSTGRELATIGKLSTFVLHDLKNQVSGLSLMLENARDYIDDPEFQEDMLSTVDTTVRNMKGLIARLKNVKEKPQLATTAVELGTIVNDAVETAGGQIEVSGSSIQIAVDEEEIYKVILNLLVNAHEACGHKAAVTVTYGTADHHVWINVADRGCGMSEEFIRDRLFQPFATTKEHGFGIGLYQCRQIMEAHGGSIAVESQIGAGTTFTLRLPLKPIFN